jgi:tetratricopeptide (TPR) repeat protein
MYEEARQLHNAQEWQAVVSVFSEINTLDPDYPDQEGFLAIAQKQVILLEQRRKLESLYSNALEAMNTGDWTGAHKLFIQVLEIDPAYEDAERLSKLAEEEIQRQESAHQQALLISSLYQEAIDSYNAGDWGVALSKLDEILRLDPDFSDPDDIRTRAQTRAQEEQRLADQFSQALEHLETQNWSQAIETFQDILKNDPEYNDPTYGSAATLLNRAKQEKERSELPPPPIKKSTKPSTLPEVGKPTGKPKDLPR